MIFKEFANLRDEYGSNLLGRNIKAGTIETVRELLKMGVTVDQVDMYGLRPLNYAIERGNATMIRLLLEHGADPNRGIPRDFCPLDKAIYTGMEDVVEILLEHGASVHRLPGEMPVVNLAIRYQREAALKLLLQYGAPCDSRSLEMAIKELNYDAVKLLLESGFKLTGPLSTMALNLSITGGDWEMVRLLLENGAQVNIMDESGATPLLIASCVGYASICQLLIKHGADFNVMGKKKLTPLWGSCLCGSYEATKVLIDNGANVKKCEFSELRGTLLVAACREGSVPLIELLLQSGLKKGLNERKNYTCLHVLCERMHVDSLKYLLECGMDPNPPIYVNGDTPLTKAIKSNNIEAVKLLLKHGADVNEPSQDEVSPFQLAAREGHSKIASLLAKHGAAIGDGYIRFHPLDNKS